VSYGTIRVLEWVGLASDVVTTRRRLAGDRSEELRASAELPLEFVQKSLELKAPHAPQRNVRAAGQRPRNYGKGQLGQEKAIQSSAGS
jgi:hypothetical protein